MPHLGHEHLPKRVTGAPELVHLGAGVVHALVASNCGDRVTEWGLYDAEAVDPAQTIMKHKTHPGRPGAYHSFGGTTAVRFYNALFVDPGTCEIFLFVTGQPIR